MESFIGVFGDLIKEKAWSEFEFSSNEAEHIILWWEQGILIKPTAELLTVLLKMVNISRCPILKVHSISIKFITIIEDLDIDRYFNSFYRFSFYDFTCKNALGNSSQTLSCEEFKSLLKDIPKKWYCSVKTTKVTIDSFTPLSGLLYYLKILCGNDTETIRCYIDFFASILDMQSNIEYIRDPFNTPSLAFDEQKIALVLTEKLTEIELNWGKQALEYTLKRLMKVFNSTDKNGKVFNQIFTAFQNCAKNSSHPLLYVEQSCYWIASAEKMALICEIGIAKFVESITSPMEWDSVSNYLHVPEMEESLFIRHCLSHCLIYTLYTHALIRLKGANEEELKIVIGEQIGVWIESLRWEAITVGEER
jgi:hypothetical protein